MILLSEDALIHEDRDAGLSVDARRSASSDFIALLERTEFGGEGLRYRRLGIARQLARLPRANFLELRHRGELLGTYALASRRLSVGGVRVEGVYRGLLAVAPDARGLGLGRYLVGKTFEWLAAGLGDTPTLSWGCIESNNQRSLAVLRSLGASRLGALDSLLSYRQWPRARIDIEELSSPDVIAAALRQSYEDCDVTSHDPTSTPFYAVTGEDGIVAGARAVLTRVNMGSSGRVWDSLYDRLFRHVPAARRRYDPRNFRYLRLSDVVVRPGQERVFRDFLTTLLARHEVHMAMFMLDSRSRAYATLREAGLFGRFSESTRQRIDVLANAWNIPPERLELLLNKPLAIGPLDI